MKWLMQLILVGSVLAQGDPRIGDGFDFGVPFGTKMIDVGFRNWDAVNVSTVKGAEWFLLRWKGDPDAYYEVRVGFPKEEVFVGREFGLVREKFHFEIYETFRIGQKDRFLYKAGYFDFLVQVVAYNNGAVKTSQVRYIKQRARRK